MLFGMFSILAAWIFLWLAISGLGLLLLRLIAVEIKSTEVFFAAFWLGWSLILAVLQIWHFFAPVNTIIFSLLAIIGIVGFFYAAYPVKEQFFKFVSEHQSSLVIFALSLLIFAFWLANRAMAEIMPGDAGLYHLGMVRWIESHPIVCGIGNLHGRFAFNNSYFLFLAFLDFADQPDFYHLSAGLLILAFSLQSGFYILKAVTNRTERQTYQLLGMLLMVPTLSFVFTSATSTSPDIPVFILGVVIGLHLFKVLFSNQELDEMTFDTVMIVVLSAVGVSVKLCLLVYGSLAALISITRLLASRQGEGKVPFPDQKLGWAVLFAALVLIPWSVRGIFLSGYVAYPNSLISMNVKWKVPEQKAVSEAQWIQSWAKDSEKKPDQVLGSWDWLLPSIHRTLLRPSSWVAIFLPILFFISGVLIYLTQVRFKIREVFWISLFLLPSIASLIFWFFTAPSIRLAGAVIWVLGAGAFSASLHWVEKQGLRKVSAAVSLLLLALVFVSGSRTNGLLIPPGSDQGFYPIPPVRTVQFQTRSGLLLNVPVGDDKCWDAPLPCTPYPDPDLHLIEDGYLSSGFMVVRP